MRGYLFIIVIMAIVSPVLTGFSFAEDWELPDPVFHKIDYMGVSGIDEFNTDYALVMTDSAASLFVSPFDAIVLHVEYAGTMRDVFIISDIGMDRLTMWQSHINPAGTGRIPEHIAAYYGDPEGFPPFTLKSPSGLECTAKNREFIPTCDLIYVADRGNGRILVFAYTPNSTGGQFDLINTIGEGYLTYPVDISLSAYGDQDPNNADLYIADMGSQTVPGKLFRFSLDGVCEASWSEFTFKESSVVGVTLEKPMSVGCFPIDSLSSYEGDLLDGYNLIYISDEESSTLYSLIASTDTDPYFDGLNSFQFEVDFRQSGGLAVDDFGRIYGANTAAGIIEIYGPRLDQLHPTYGELGEGPGQLNYPKNIIIDTYNTFCEAMIIEFYERQSGLQSFYIENGWSATKPPLGLAPGWQFIRPFVDTAELPKVFKLYNSYPNPFNSNCIISFDVPVKSKVKLDIYNLLGQRVATPVDKALESGNHSVNFDAENLASGVYFYRLRTENFNSVKKMMLLK
ncbi:MAG: T9SS type A sorting domain-containing protein [candidate division Zixibacteria bacterium]|nr:T9SS type A sorting domain-containing protein [candidate division Zixibacteria bacterium]